MIRVLSRKALSWGESSAVYIPFCTSPLWPPSIPSVHLLELLIMIVISGLLISRTLAVWGGPCEGKEKKLLAMQEVTDRRLPRGQGRLHRSLSATLVNRNIVGPQQTLVIE